MKTANFDYELSDLPAIAGGEPIRSPEKPLIFGTPVISDADVAAVSDCLRSRWIGSGSRVEQFEEDFARYKNAPSAVAVSSGTAAIHLALLALGIGTGDEVIAPTMTFCSTVHSIVHVGAVPVLVDCQGLTFNIDPEAIDQHITAKTKAIVVVHMCGRCCEMDAILDLARRHKLRVIEDCAHAIESSYHGEPAGLLGDVGCFSFYATKNMTTGDGGMVIARDAQICRRVRILSTQGMTANAWTRSVRRRNTYKVVAAGFKYNMTDISAALGLSQLAQLEARWVRRKATWQSYSERLSDLPLVLPSPTEPDTRHSYHLYTVLLALEKLTVSRDRVVVAMAAEHIQVGTHYLPVHLQPYYRRRLQLRSSDFPNATFVGMRTLSLPLVGDMSMDDVSDVCLALERILRCFDSRRGNEAGRIPSTIRKSKCEADKRWSDR